MSVLVVKNQPSAAQGAYQLNDIVSEFPDGYSFGRPDESFEPKHKIYRLDGEPVRLMIDSPRYAPIDDLLSIEIIEHGGKQLDVLLDLVRDKGRGLIEKRRYAYDNINNLIIDKDGG